MGQNYPNPFNPTTTISFKLSKAEFVSIKVYNLLGEEVATLVNERLAPGSYNEKFDASHLSSGAYFFMIKDGAYSQARQMMLIK